MGATGNSNTTAALTAKTWQKELYLNAIDNLYFVVNGMMGKEDNNIVQFKDELAKSKGDTITYGLTAKLTGAGVTGSNELEGNEEVLTPYSDSVAIDLWRDAVRLNGRLQEQKAAYDMRKDARQKLEIVIQEFIERQIFTKLGGVRNANLTDINGTSVYPVSGLQNWSNSAPVVSNTQESAGTGARYLSAAYDPIAAAGNNSNFAVGSNNLSPDLLRRLRVKAYTSSPKIVPLRIKGKNYWVVFIHPSQGMDLKRNTEFRESMREAQVRGDENPIFTGALGIWDGLVLHEHEYVPYLNPAVSGIVANFAGDSAAGSISYGAPTARAILCGSQAVAFAKAKFDNGWVEKYFDYDDKVGFSTGLLGGIQKVTFNSVPYGAFCLDTTVSAG